MKAAEEMTREELIAYDKWLTRRKWGTGEIISPEKAADLYLAEHPLPPAEGAEEILDKYPHSTEYPSFIHENSAIAAMHEFATLHAQKIADKMVSERLREELIAYDTWLQTHKWRTSDIDTPTQAVNKYFESRKDSK